MGKIGTAMTASGRVFVFPLLAVVFAGLAETIGKRAKETDFDVVVIGKCKKQVVLAAGVQVIEQQPPANAPRGGGRSASCRRVRATG